MSRDESFPTGESQASPEQRFLNYARTGNKATVHALIQEFADISYKQARRIVGQDDGAEDAVQEAFLRLIISAKRYDGSVPFAAWIGRLVYVTAIDYRRQLNRQRREHASANIEDLGVAVEQDRKVSDAPDFEALRAALDSLPDRYRAPLTLHFFGGLSRIETAQALGVPADTIVKQLGRGLERLRAKLGRAGFSVTSASLLAWFASVPAYAASPEFNPALLASRRLAAQSGPIGSGIAQAKAFLTGSTLYLTGPIGIFLAGVAVFASIQWKNSIMPPQTNPAVFTRAAPDPSDRGLIGYWKFDEGDGPVAIDSSLNRNAGTALGSPMRVLGRFGGGMKFDGIDDYVYVPDSPSLDSIKEQMTITAWAMRTGLTATPQEIAGRRRGAEGDDLWGLYCARKNTSEILGFGVDTSQVSGISGNAFTQFSESDLNQWVHWAGVYDGRNALSYRNGILVSSVPCRGTLTDEESPLVFGAADNGLNGIDEFLIGSLDEIRLYNRALSENEIADVMNSVPKP